MMPYQWSRVLGLVRSDGLFEHIHGQPTVCCEAAVPPRDTEVQPVAISWLGVFPSLLYFFFFFFLPISFFVPLRPTDQASLELGDEPRERFPSLDGYPCVLLKRTWTAE